MNISLVCPSARLARLILLGTLAASAARAQITWQAFQPPTVSHTGAAVLIVSDRAGDGEVLARWLSARGLAGFTLVAPGPTAAEVTRALGELRGRAAELKISPRRIAVIGLGSGAELAAQAAFAAADAKERPALLALVGGGRAPAASLTSDVPPTLLIGSTASADRMADQMELWNKLRAARASVDAHFFAKPETTPRLHGVGQVSDLPMSGQRPDLLSWPDIFFAWARFNGLLTDLPRVPVKGTLRLDGRTLPHGYVILTPADFVGAGPIVGWVLNSSANVPMGQFSLPASRGPVPGRYKVDVRQNMNRWLSNSFSGGLVSGSRGGTPITADQKHFGHHRVLAPNIADQRSFTKVRPSDRDEYIIEIKPGAEANLDLQIEVFSGALATPASPAIATSAGGDDAIGGIRGGPKNPGQIAYVEQIKAGAIGPVAGIPEPVLLWPAGAPDAVTDAEGVFTDEDKPALYPFPVAGAKNTGTAFLIVPGGAFTNRGMDNEGVQVARFLNRHGIAGFVLRYRIGPNYPRRTFSTMDAHRAMRHLRANAAHYGISPDRIGTIGFSAGAELQGDAFYNAAVAGDANAADPLDRLSAHANFCALIYGGRNLQKPATSPPTFLFNTIEDAGHLTVQISVLNSLRQAGVPVEAHFYQVGPHGTALSPGDPLLGQWPDHMIGWLGSIGMIPSRR